MKILKVVLLAVFVIATPLLMFRQAVVISDGQNEITELRIKHIHDSVTWALRHAIDSMALKTKDTTYKRPGTIRVVVDYSKIPKYNDPPYPGKFSGDLNFKLDSLFIHLSREISDSASAANYRWNNDRKIFYDLLQQLRDSLNQKQTNNKYTQIADQGINHAEDLLKRINSLNRRQKERLGLTDDEVANLLQIIDLLKQR